MLTVDEKTNKNFTEEVYKNSKQLPIYLMLLKCKKCFFFKVKKKQFGGLFGQLSHCKYPQNNRAASILYIRQALTSVMKNMLVMHMYV